MKAFVGLGIIDLEEHAIVICAKLFVTLAKSNHNQVVYEHEDDHAKKLML